MDGSYKTFFVILTYLLSTYFKERKSIQAESIAYFLKEYFALYKYWLIF